MSNVSFQAGQPSVISREELSLLLAALRAEGYKLIGPRARDNAIVYAELEGVGDLPAGLTEEQEAGVYRLRHRTDEALFGYAVGPHSLKPFFFVPALRLWRARRANDGFELLEEAPEIPKLALLGVRACDLSAVAIQDKIFMGCSATEPDYAARRGAVFVIAVNCSEAGGTCFCASMQTGPRASFGFDLALTELLDEQGHRFLVEVGTEAGASLLSRVPHRAAEALDQERALEVSARTRRNMGRALDTVGIKELLYGNLEHPRWDDVAARCLACANCTMVCPTCFCSTVEDVTDLTGENAERVRRWDSCFTLSHSYLHGGSVRASHRARYRQWLTHKLASWLDQFGSSGCVGCGRCITWCPVKIDITEEVAAIRATDARRQGEG